MSLFRRHNRRCIAFVLWLVALAMPAQSVHAADEPLTIGVFPRRNSAETGKLFTPMADYLGERLGRKVRLVTAKNFATFWRAVTEQQFDIVHYNQYHYIRSAHNYQVIAHIEEFGKNTISGVVYVRKDSGITDLTQLKGRTVIFGGGEDAMISYIVPRYLLLQAGLKKDDFKSLFAVNPPNAILALSRRQADAAGGGDVIVEFPAVRNAADTDELLTLAVSSPLLHLPLAVKRNMPSRLRESIQTVLVDLHKSEAGKRVLKSAALTGIGRAEDKDYDPHRRIVAMVAGAESSTNRSARGVESNQQGR